MDRNRKRGIRTLVLYMLILMGTTSMRGFENVRGVHMLMLFFAGMNAGAALMFFLGLGNRY